MIDHDRDQDVPELVARAQRGDHTAFAALHDRFAARLYRFVRFRVGDASDAEDVVQRVFLKVIEALPRYEERGTPFAAWLFRLARNTVIDHVRTRHATDPLEDQAARPAPGQGPEELAIAADELAALEVALGQLTTEQRDVVAYRFFAGLSPAEIGLIMGKREGTVRALQFRALGALRRELMGASGRQAAVRPERVP
jgi:RNA polymerase sigma-70 factor (ECF subfamily)